MSDHAARGGSMAQDRAPSLLRLARDRWGQFRTRLVANPNFRQFASSFRLTRPVARRRTRALFDLAAGFVYSQVLAAFVRLDLVTFLDAGPATLAQIADKTGLNDDRALSLLRASIALDLAAECADGCYRLGETGAALVENDGVLAMIAHHQMLYEDLADPVALLKGERETQLSSFWSYAGGEKTDDAAAAPYSQLMARSQAMVAREVLDVLPLKRHRRLLDFGGGSGAFAIEAARRHPHLEVGLFDLPAVAEIARGAIASSGLEGRVSAHGGSFFEDAPPDGFDVVTLNRILHDHDDAPALQILRAGRRSLADGGMIVLAEPMAGTPGAEPAIDTYFGFYLLAMGQGRPRDFGEIAGLMAQAGFAHIRELPTATPLIVRVLTARKAGVTN